MIILALVQGLALFVLVVRLLPGRHRAPPVAPRAEPGTGLTGDISILVPTFNEAARIAPCLAGLAAQDAAVKEILFIDSGSTDGTVALIERAARDDARVRLLRDDPLPDGWVGKVWALEHGLRHASGEWVLGIDADTTPRAGLAGGVRAAALEHEYEAVSFSPRFAISSRGEQWLQPALLVTLVYRFGAAGADTTGERVMANGQCFFARRATLLAEGGYAPARGSFSDDVTLARHLARRGHRVGFLDGSRLYDVRAYTSARETWREWGRSLDLSDSTTGLRQAADVLFLLVVQGSVLPALLWVALSASTGRSALLATSGVLLAIRILLMSALRGSYASPGVAFWLSPLADPLAAVRIFLSTIRRPRSWRGRAFVAGGSPPLAPT